MCSEILYAFDRIKTCLNNFFSALLRDELGENTRYAPKVLAEALHRMLCTGASISLTADSMGLTHTPLMKFQQVNRKEQKSWYPESC